MTVKSIKEARALYCRGLHIISGRGRNMKPLKVPSWFGDITPEELAAVQDMTTDYAKQCEKFQQRERYSETETATDNDILRA